MMELTLQLDLLAPVDWRVLREARLSALLDSPYAFTSSYAHESTWQEPDWRRLFNAATWVVARESEKVIGLARSIGEPELPDTRHVESVWVAPTHRRRGVFRALMRALAESERQAGIADLLLWVLEGNDDAQRAYEALGFEPTGDFPPGVRTVRAATAVGRPTITGIVSRTGHGYAVDPSSFRVDIVAKLCKCPRL